MVSAGRHPKNAINSAISDLPAGFVVVEIHKGHRWGVVKCVACGESVRVSSTPRVPEYEAGAISRFVHRHQVLHTTGGGER